MTEPQTHPKNFEIINKVATALFVMLQNSIAGKRVLRQQISAVQVNVMPVENYQNVEDGESEAELAVTILFSGAPSQSVKFKFSELVMPVASPAIAAVEPVKDETIPTDTEGLPRG